MIVLGLDISTTTTAYTLIDTDQPLGQRLVESKGIHLSKIKDPYAKSCEIRRVFKNISKKVTVDKIVIEESLQSFRSGLSSARTLSSLTRFNGIVSFLAQDIFTAHVERINVNSARSKIGIKIDRKSDVSTKDQVKKWVMSHEDFSLFEWPTKTLKSGPRKGQTIDDPTCLDIADSAVMALCVL